MVANQIAQQRTATDSDSGSDSDQKRLGCNEHTSWPTVAFGRVRVQVRVQLMDHRKPTALTDAIVAAADAVVAATTAAVAGPKPNELRSSCVKRNLR